MHAAKRDEYVKIHGNISKPVSLYRTNGINRK